MTMSAESTTDQMPWGCKNRKHADENMMKR